MAYYSNICGILRDVAKNTKNLYQFFMHLRMYIYRRV